MSGHFYSRVNGVLNILFFFEFTNSVGFNIYSEVHTGLDDTYDNLVFAAHADQFAAEAGEAADHDFNLVALRIDVIAHLHLGIAAAEDAEVCDLCLGYGNRFAFDHYEFDHTVYLADGEVVLRDDIDENV